MEPAAAQYLGHSVLQQIAEEQQDLILNGRDAEHADGTTGILGQPCRSNNTDGRQETDHRPIPPGAATGTVRPTCRGVRHPRPRLRHPHLRRRATQHGAARPDGSRLSCTHASHLGRHRQGASSEFMARPSSKKRGGSPGMAQPDRHGDRPRRGSRRKPVSEQRVRHAFARQHRRAPCWICGSGSCPRRFHSRRTLLSLMGP